jgi:hypothetical protein
MFMAIVIFFAGFFGFVGLLRFIVVAIRKQKFSKLLKEVFVIFKEFQYSTDITLFLGLFSSANDEKAVEEVYNKPGNLETAQKTVINMWSRG